MNIRFPIALALGGALLAACGGGGGGSTGVIGTTTPPPSQSSTLSLSLMDTPFLTPSGVVSAVTITIAKAEAVDSDGVIHLIGTFSPAKRINLLDYQTSTFSLGSNAIPSGQYNQVRLVLDTSTPDNTTIVVDGTTYPLSIPSVAGIGFGGSTSTDSGDGSGTLGIRVKAKFTVQDGLQYAYLLDFNAAESVGETGAGQWAMHPVLVATAQTTSCSLSGTVTNTTSGPVSGAEVVADQSGTAINSSETDSNGNFNINALVSGETYTLTVHNVWTNQAGATLTAVGASTTADVTLASPLTCPNSNVSITD